MLSVISATCFAITTPAPKSVSSDFGKLDVFRHLMTGSDCAMAGDAIDALAAPTADTFRKSRRFMKYPRTMLEPCLSELRAPKKDYRQPLRTGVFSCIAINILRSKKARPYGRAFVRSCCDRSTAGARPDLEAIERVFGNLPPQIRVAAEGLHRLDGLLEIRVLRRNFSPQSVGCLETGFEHFIAERTKLRAASNQTLQRARVLQIVPCLHIGVSVGVRVGQNCLIVLRQRVPLLKIGERVDHQAAFPEARIVVIRRHLVEAELLVVIRTDPLGRVDRALLQRWIDVAARDLLRHDAKLRQHLPGDAADAHLQAGKIVNGLDLLAEPAAHLSAGVAARMRNHTMLLEESIAKLLAAALVPPGVLHARIEAERNGRVNREGRILADIIVGRGMEHLDVSCTPTSLWRTFESAKPAV